jgi:hypothetical protein
LASYEAELIPSQASLARGIIDPNVWLWGKYYLNLMNSVHPDRRSLMKESSVLPGGSVSLAQVNALGERIRAFMATMAVTSDGKLRDQLFAKLFDRYSTLVDRAIDRTDRARRAKAGDDPLAGREFSESPPNSRLYNFLAPDFHVERCDDAQVVTLEDKNAIISGFLGVEFPAYFDNDRRTFARYFSTELLRMTPSFVQLIPNSVLLALKSKYYEGALLCACFKSIELPLIEIKRHTPPFCCRASFGTSHYFHAKLYVDIKLTLTYYGTEAPWYIRVKGRVRRSWCQVLKQLISGSRTDDGDSFSQCEGEYRRLLAKEKHDIQEELSSFIRDTDSEIAKIKAASLFLVRYCIDTTDPSAL